MDDHRAHLRPLAWPACLLCSLALACNATPPAAPVDTMPVTAVVLPSPTVPVLPTAESPTAEAHVPPAGWLTYTNSRFGYAFDYPAEAELIEVGVTGYPTEELPAGVDPGQYLATLEATYTEAICAGVRYGAAYLYVMAPEAEGGRYSMPCGVSGIGAYDVRRVEEPLAIGEEDLTVTGAAVYNQDDGSFMYETFMTRLRDFHYNYGGDWTQAGTSYEAYLADKAIIQQVLASWRWLE